MSEFDEKVAYLQQYRRSLSEWKALAQEAREVREISTSISINFSGMPGGRGDAPSKLESGIEGLEKLSLKVSSQMADVYALRKAVSDTIDTVKDNRQRRVLRLYYLHGYTWAKVAKATGYDERYCRRLHNKAVADILWKN